MSLPNSFQSGRMTNATTGDQVDDKVGDLEKTICDIHGIPIDTPIAAPGFLWDAAGLKKTIFQDNAADPAASGELLRNGQHLKAHLGSVRRLIVELDHTATEVTVISTVAEVTVFSSVIPAGYLGTNNFVHASYGIFVSSILDAASLVIRASYGGVAFLIPILNNASGGALGGFVLRVDVRVSARNSATAQWALGEIKVAPISPGLNFGISSLWSYFNGGLLAINSALAQSLSLTLQWSGASASNSVTGVGMDIR